MTHNVREFYSTNTGKKIVLLELRSLLISVNTKFCFLALLAVHDHVAAMLLGQKLALVKPYHPQKTRIQSDDPFGVRTRSTSTWLCCRDQTETRTLPDDQALAKTLSGKNTQQRSC